MKRKDRSLFAWFGIILALSMLCTGCKLFVMAAYLMGGDLTPAACKDLKGKKVVVVCQPQVQLPIGGQDAAQKLAKQVGRLLKKNVSKIEVVDHEKVADWMDTHSFMDSDSSNDYVIRVGRAMDADVVVCIDLMQFNIRENQTLLRGRAQYELKVIDCRSTEELFGKLPDPTIWPPNTGVSTMSKSENVFQRRFIGVLADEITRYFYRHDGRSEFAGDIKALQ